MSAGLFSRIEKAFDALSVYNYFEARELFQKSLKKDSVAASYGLSIIYGRDDNPFTQLDSAHKYINIAKNGWGQVDEKSRLEYSDFGVDSLSIARQEYVVDSLAFERAESLSDIEAWNTFIEEFDNAGFRAAATDKRDAMVFHLVKKENTSKAYANFLSEYPNSAQRAEAKRLFDLRNFEERTATGDLRDYQAFIDSFPASPYVPVAEERIYLAATAGGTAADYLNFIESFPTNPFVDIAWRKIYALEVKEINAESIAAFTLNYPEYPFMDELKQEFDLAITKFYPVSDGDYWGFINDEGEIAIDLKFEWVENFSDGIAMVGMGDKLAYIDKEGDEISEEAFSDGFAFSKGFAVVEKNDYYGVINRIGDFVVDPLYDDIGENAEGLFYAEKDGYYGFINEQGEIAIPFVYSDALDFHQGVAVVADSSGMKGMINKGGAPLTAFEFDWIESLQSVELPVRFRKDGQFGLINRGGLVLTDTLYDALGEWNDGLALAASDGKYGFLNTNGDTVIDFLYSYSPEALTTSKFENGYAKVFQKVKVGVIDSAGVKAFPAIFEDVGSYAGSLIPVKKRGKWGYSNLDVNLSIGYNFSYAFNFKDSLAIAAKDGLYGVIDTLGKTRIPFAYASMEWVDTLLMVQDSAYGIITLEQDTLVPLIYQKIIRVDDKVLQLKHFNGRYDYFDLPRNRFLRREEISAE